MLVSFYMIMTLVSLTDVLFYFSLDSKNPKPLQTLSPINPKLSLALIGSLL